MGSTCKEDAGDVGRLFDVGHNSSLHTGFVTHCSDLIRYQANQERIAVVEVKGYECTDQSFIVFWA